MPLREDILHLIDHDNALAQQLLRDLTHRMPTSADAWILLANAHDRRLEFEQSIDSYERALELEPTNVLALRGAGLAEINLGDYEAALARFTKITLETSHAHALRLVALLQHRMGRLAESISTYERVLTGAQPTSPEIAPALQGLARALRDAGRPLASDQHMRQLMSRFHASPMAVASGLVVINTSADRPEWSTYADKAVLAEFLTRRFAIDPVGARIPESFVLPRDREALTAFAASDRAPSLYIVKPVRSSGGQGITFAPHVEDVLDRQNVVVQRYIDRPYLVNGRKGHARIYGLITSVAPLRGFVYGEGLVRFAPGLYDTAAEHAGDVSRHITNTALHVGHRDLIISQDPAEEDQGMIWTLSALLKRMSADGLDGQRTFAEIHELAAWFVRQLHAEGMFERQAAAAPPRAFAPKLFGLDVLIDADGRPWLIEMQRAPAAKGPPLVERVNAEMLVTMFRMTHGPLLDDDMTAARAAEILSDAPGRVEREAEIERLHQGRFSPLDLEA